MAETIISKFVSLIQTKVDPKSVQQTQATLKSVRSFAAKTLGVLGIGFSLSWLKNITEEFKSANDQIRGATEGLEEQAEIQKKILAAANSCRESYSDMAGYVTSLTSNSSKSSQLMMQRGLHLLWQSLKKLPANLETRMQP